MSNIRQAPQPFAVRVGESGDGPVRLVLEGELDLYSVGALLRAFEGARGQDVHVDLSELEFVDSQGIGALVAAAREAERHDRRIVVGSTMTPPVRRVLELTGVLALLPLVD